MFKWKKYGLIFNPTKYENIFWLDEFAQAPAVLIFDEYIRVYFSGRPKPDANMQYVSYTGFVDIDRFDFSKILYISEKPILELGGTGTFDEFGIYPTSVYRENNEVVAYYGGWTRCESVPFNVSIGMAKSLDNGITFSKIGKGPILSHSINEPFILSGPKIRKFNNIWYLYYIAGKEWIWDNCKPEPVYKIRLATSTDGIDWKKHNQNLIPDELDENECQASPDVFYYNNLYHMFFCYRQGRNYRGKEGGYRIGYAYSSDLINWTRNDSLAGITVSDSGWDSEMVAYPHVFELDNEIYMFYLGNHVGKYGFGMAKLEK